MICELRRTLVVSARVIAGFVLRLLFFLLLVGVSGWIRSLLRTQRMEQSRSLQHLGDNLNSIYTHTTSSAHKKNWNG